MGLLAAQGSSILGMQNEETQGWPAHGEIRWYERQDTFEDADFCRIIRSVGVGGFCLDDVMDVLVMGVPFGYFFAPSLTMVEPAARRLAAAAGTITTTTTARTVTGHQLGVLGGLLSRVNTNGTIRALRCYSGDLDEGDGHREIGECMMERLGLGEGELREADYSRVVDAVVFFLLPLSTHLSMEMLMISRIYALDSTPCGAFSSNQTGMPENQRCAAIDSDTRYSETGKLLCSLLSWRLSCPLLTIDSMQYINYMKYCLCKFKRVGSRSKHNVVNCVMECGG